MKWQEELRNNITTVDELKKYIKFSPEEEQVLREVITIHPMNISRYYLSLINRKNPNDPIRKMVIPSVDELNTEGSYDPSREADNTKLIGLQHKYDQTALILATNRYGTYCRYCFRKRMIGLPTSEIIHRFNLVVNHIKQHKEINNVLISGGDPFILPTKVIEEFLKKLSTVKHLDFIRFGTKTPVTFPHRILYDNSLIKTLQYYSDNKKRIYIVTHFNHEKELTEKSIEAVSRLLHAGILVSNQTVLLKDINDNVITLVKLIKKLVNVGIIPYYVFQCRPVKRVKKIFQIPLYNGYRIIEEAKKHLDGHGKRFRYIMSHTTGKIETIGIEKDRIYFKYHQAKNPKKLGRIYVKKLDKKATWFDDLKNI